MDIEHGPHAKRERARCPDAADGPPVCIKNKSGTRVEKVRNPTTEREHLSMTSAGYLSREILSRYIGEF